MQARRSDSILLFLAVTLIVWSFLLLYSRSSQNREGSVIGQMVESNLQVRSRLTKSLTWKDLSGGASVIDDQYIFTGNEAFAKIQLTSGPVLDIGEKTLIRLNQTDRNALRVEQGIVKVKVSEKTPFEIDLDGKRVSISSAGAEVVMNIQDNIREIGVTSGEAEVKLDNQTQKLTSKEIVSISTDKMDVAEKISLLSPKDGERFYQEKPSRSVELSWDFKETVTLEISTDSHFKNIITTKKVDSSFKTELKKGHYYWRVRSLNARAQASSFTIIQETPPQVLSPRDGEVVRVVDYQGEESILLSWDAGEDLVDLEIKTPEGIQKIEKIHASHSLKVDKSFPLSFRVKKNIMNRPETVWTSWQNIEVIYLKAPVVPEKLSPVDYEQITYGEGPKNIELKWNGNSSSYYLEVKTGQHLETIKVDKNLYEYILKSPNAYEWRVRGIDEFERESEFSSWQKFSWRDESASLHEKAQKIVLKRPSQKVNFSWEDPQGEEVQFELSEDSTFKDIVIQKKLHSDRTEITFPNQGTYFWRTQKISSKGEKVLSPPKKVIIEPAPAPERPETLPETEVPLEYIETTFHKTWFDYLIPRAFASDLQLVAPLSWPKKDEAEFYLIEIYSDPNGENKTHELKTQETSYRWKNPKIGEYYWRWAVVDYWGRVSPYSELSLLKVTPPQNFKLEKTKLLSPIRKIELPPTKAVRFSWTEVKETENYIFELASDDDFDDLVKKETLSQTTYEVSPLPENDYYWKVTTKKWDQSRESSTGRFTIKEEAPPLQIKEEIKKETFSLPKSLLILSWAPSLDTFEFETKDSEGDISGNVLVGFKLEYQKQINNLWRGEVSLLHQSGKVFDEENYKFRQTKIGALRRLGENIFVTPTIGLVEFQEYTKQGDKLKSKDQRGFDLGAELRYELNYPKSKWDIAGELRAGQVLSYGLSLRRWSEKWTQAVLLQNRTFDNSGFEGTQTSIRLEIGRLFSFDK